MHSILVRDYMDHNPKVVSDCSNIKDAVELLLNSSLIGAPVVGGDQNLVGYISEQDCIKEMLNDAFYCEEPGPVTDVMSQQVLTVTPETSIVEVAQRLLCQKPKNYPVIEAGKLVGVISRTNVLRALLENDQDCYLRQ